MHFAARLEDLYRGWMVFHGHDGEHDGVQVFQPIGIEQGEAVLTAFFNRQVRDGGGTRPVDGQDPFFPQLDQGERLQGLGRLDLQGHLRSGIPFQRAGRLRGRGGRHAGVGRKGIADGKFPDFRARDDGEFMLSRLHPSGLSPEAKRLPDVRLGKDIPLAGLIKGHGKTPHLLVLDDQVNLLDAAVRAFDFKGQGVCFRRFFPGRCVYDEAEGSHGRLAIQGKGDPADQAVELEAGNKKQAEKDQRDQHGKGKGPARERKNLFRVVACEVDLRVIEHRVDHIEGNGPGLRARELDCGNELLIKLGLQPFEYPGDLLHVHRPPVGQPPSADCVGHDRAVYRYRQHQALAESQGNEIIDQCRKAQRQEAKDHGVPGGPPELDLLQPLFHGPQLGLQFLVMHLFGHVVSLSGPGKA